MSTDAVADRSTAIRWRNAVFAIFALNGFATAAWISRVPALRDGLAIDVREAGFLIVGVSVGSVTGLLLSSHVVHWLGGRRTLFLTLIGQGIGLTVIGLGATTFASFAMVFVGLAIFGFSSGTCDVAMNVEGAGAERATGCNIMPWFHAAWSLGTVAGGGLGTLMAAFDVAVVVHLAVIGVLTAVVGPVLTRWIPRHAEVDEHGESTKLGLRERLAIWLEPRTLLIGLIMLGMAFAEGSANDWLALAMVDDRGLDNAGGALLFTVFTVAMTVGRIAGVPALDRFGRVPVLRVAGAAAVVGLTLVIFVDWLPATVAGIVLWGLGASLGFPVGMSAAADDPRKAAARVSAVATIGYFAFLVGPPVIGIIGHSTGLLYALILVLALIVVSVLASPAARAEHDRADRVPVGG